MKKIKINLFLLMFLILILSPLRSSLRGDFALSIIREISGEEYMGRQAGTLGNFKALDFVEKELKLLGLSEVIYQEFPVEVFEYKDIPKLILKYEESEIKSYKYREDFRDRFSGNYEKEAYVRSNIQEIKNSFWITSYKGNISRDIAVADIYGAEGIIVGLSRNMVDLLSQRSLYFLKENIPVVYVAPWVYEEILSYLKSKRQIKMYYKIEYKKEIDKAYNLLFYIPSERNTKKTIVLTAHIDHVGRDYDGSYFPGANDNASGVGVLMEIAKELLEGGNRYPFNFLFLITNAEEKGLLGANYFMENPTISLEDVILNINFDCVGRGKKRIISYNSYAKKIVEKLRFMNNVEFVKDFFINESDQYLFHLYEIPFLFFINTEENEEIPSLHNKTDTWNKISRENLMYVINDFFSIMTILSLNSF